MTLSERLTKLRNEMQEALDGFNEDDVVNFGIGIVEKLPEWIKLIERRKNDGLDKH